MNGNVFKTTFSKMSDERKIKNDCHCYFKYAQRINYQEKSKSFFHQTMFCSVIRHDNYPHQRRNNFK